jgi:hypothetical protein
MSGSNRYRIVSSKDVRGMEDVRIALGNVKQYRQTRSFASPYGLAEAKLDAAYRDCIELPSGKIIFLDELE